VRLPQIAFLIVFSLLTIVPVDGQSPNGTISGIVVDPSGAAIVGAEILIANDATGVQYLTKTNPEGMYLVPNLLPGTYRLQVSEIGFKTIIKPDIVIHVQDALAINFTLPIGAASEIVTVQAGAPLINTESAAVSTIVDRQFAENLPMNGRSFQTLIDLTPGVVATTSSPRDGGQFSVNGQRAASNYWTLDGVSANIGVSATFNPGNGLGGSLGSFSALGGTNSLVSVDALQEFRIQTSTYAPEFGRTPGGQISIVTRSGANQFHGTMFDYFRNDVLDANDWFSNANKLPKPQERQNDFGGTFSGPILKEKTFFFFSYEGLRLRLPQVTVGTVPDITARQNAVAAIQPYLNAYPLPTPGGSDNTATGIAEENASYSNPATLDAYSLRIDHRLSNKWTLFGRYSYSPSKVLERGGSNALSVVEPISITTQTGTVGATWSASPSITNDVRFNYSRTNASSYSYLDNFGGAVPLPSLPLPSPFTTQNSSFAFFIVFLQPGPTLNAGRTQQVVQRQFNIVDSLSVQKGPHSLKFGVDYRRLSPIYSPPQYFQEPVFLSVIGPAFDAERGNTLIRVIASGNGSTFLFRNVGVYAQDTWRLAPRLTLSYGLRWDLDVAPASLNGPNVPAVTGYNLNDLSNLALAPVGTPPFKTTYGNFAPRVGIAYQLSPNQNRATVVRGGFGVFYDLASAEVGNLVANASYPFNGIVRAVGPSAGTFPFSPAQAAPPAITPANLTLPGATFYAIDPNLKLPYTLEWNFAVEQGLGAQQSISASYIGSAGRRLQQSAQVSSPNANFSKAVLVGDTATSGYHALQAQFQRRLLHGLQALASYTWSHSIDSASGGAGLSSLNTASDEFIVGLGAKANRGPSDFDIRHSFSAGATYDIPAPKLGAFAKAVLHGWSIQNFLLAHSAPPTDVYDSFFQTLNGSTADVRPDVVPGVPFYLYGSQYPGGRAFNAMAFQHPPTTPSGCNPGPPSFDFPCDPARQGNLGRNALRGFAATQWDFAVHRDLYIRESLKLQFRAEMFNVLNHPNFGPPVGGWGLSNFGLSYQTLGQSLNNGNLGGGGFNPLYQIGGPRSIQLALKLSF
jgi:outer membrane receptor protein involved in Fe transport